MYRQINWGHDFLTQHFRRDLPKVHEQITFQNKNNGVAAHNTSTKLLTSEFKTWKIKCHS